MKLIKNTKDLAKFLQLDCKTDLPIKDFQIDSRKVTKNSVFFGLNGSNVDGSIYAEDAIKNGASLAIVSFSKTPLPKDQSHNIVRVPSPEKSLIQAAKIAMQAYQGCVIGITGSNGKTTTKNILNHSIKNSFATFQNYNNEIGLPLCALSLDTKSKIAIFEMGAAKSGDIKLLSGVAKPHIGIITHIGHSHLEGLNSLKGVLDVKSELISNIQKHGVGIVPECTHTSHWKSMRNDITFYTFGKTSSASFFPTQIKMSSKGLSFFIESIHLQKKVKITTKLIGIHNILNILASFAAIHASKCSVQDFCLALKNIQNGSQRMNIQPWINQSSLINDSYNANPDSMKAAIDFLCQLQGRKVAVLGDMRELGRFRKKLHIELGEYAKIHGIDLLIGYGDLMRHAVNRFGKTGFFFKNKCDLVNFLGHHLEKKDNILLKGSRSMRMEEILTLWKKDD